MLYKIVFFPHLSSPSFLLAPSFFLLLIRMNRMLQQCCSVLPWVSMTSSCTRTTPPTACTSPSSSSKKFATPSGLPTPPWFFSSTRKICLLVCLPVVFLWASSFADNNGTEKIKKVDLNVCFPEYNGGNDYEAASEFIRETFLAQYPYLLAVA